METLKLTLKKRWFDMIASGEKKEEYRQEGPWILSRLIRGDPDRHYDAVKFTHEGSVRIRTRTEGEVAVLEVEDTGVGISDASREAIFAPFSQAEGSTTRQFGGTGLGLAICKQIVERMGGRVGVRSTPGQGSSFWCVIPFEARRAQDLLTR